MIFFNTHERLLEGMFVYLMHVVHSDSKKGGIFPETWVTVVVSLHVGVGNWVQALCKRSQCSLNIALPLQLPKFDSYTIITEGMGIKTEIKKCKYQNSYIIQLASVQITDSSCQCPVPFIISSIIHIMRQWESSKFFKTYIHKNF